MIQTKEDLNRYLLSDAKADNYTGKKPKFFGGWRNDIWKFKVYLRKAEYHLNCSTKNPLNKLKLLFYKVKVNKLGLKLGFTIPLNVFDEGLSIPHYGTIVVNGKAKVGKNCRIMAGTCIGSTSGIDEAATIGDFVYIGTGAKIIGKITIGNRVCVGANAVVTKSFDDDQTIGGIPAHKISNINSLNNFINL